MYNDEVKQKQYISQMRKRLLYSLLILLLGLAIMFSVGLVIKLKLDIRPPSPVPQPTQSPERQKQENTEVIASYIMEKLRTNYEAESCVLNMRINFNVVLTNSSNRYQFYMEYTFHRFSNYKVILFNVNDYEKIIIVNKAEYSINVPEISSAIIANFLLLRTEIPLLKGSPFSILEALDNLPAKATNKETRIPRDHYSYIVSLTNSHNIISKLLSVNYHDTHRKTEYNLLTAINKFFFNGIYAICRANISSTLAYKESNNYKYLVYFIYKYFHFYNTFRMIVFYIVIEEHIFSCDKLENKNAVNFCKDVKESKELEKLNYFIFENFYKIFGMFRVKTITPEYLKYVEDVNKHSEEFYNEMIKIFVKYK